MAQLADLFNHGQHHGRPGGAVVRLCVNVRLTDPVELDAQGLAVVVQVVGSQFDGAFAATPRAFHPAFFGAGDLGADKVLWGWQPWPLLRSHRGPTQFFRTRGFLGRHIAAVNRGERGYSWVEYKCALRAGPALECQVDVVATLGGDLDFVGLAVPADQAERR